MPLTRSALEELLDSLQDELAHRLAKGEGGVALATWWDRCAEVIVGFAGPTDRAWVQARLLARTPRPVPD